MNEVTIRELRNQGGVVVDRVERGEQLTVTRDGRPVAELRPVARAPMSAKLLIDRRRQLPSIDPDRLRRDVDEAVDPTW